MKEKLAKNHTNEYIFVQAMKCLEDFLFPKVIILQLIDESSVLYLRFIISAPLIIFKKLLTFKQYLSKCHN